MKILIVLVRWKGGVGRVISSIKPLLEKAGNEIEVISREDDLKCFSLKDSFFRLKKEVKKRDYDILYTQDWSCALPFLFWKKHYCCFHGNDPNKFGRLMQNLVGKIIGKRLIVVGKYNNLKFPKSHYIPNSIDINQFKPLKKIKRVYLGWINKTTEMINKDEILKVGNEVNLPVSIAENVPSNKMNEWYNSLKVFISLPPKSAGHQLSWMEAMAAGVPRIIGNYNGDGGNYPITQIDNFKNLREAVEKSKKRDYRALLKKKRESWKNHVNRLLEVLKNEKRV